MSDAPVQSTSENGQPSLFYRVELYEQGQLAAIEFFDQHQLGEAIERATAKVQNGEADRADVFDDCVNLVFRHPERPAQMGAGENVPA